MFYTGTGGPFAATVTAYDDRGKTICSAAFNDLQSLGPNPDQYQCGLGSGANGFVTSRPATTPTPAPSCNFAVNRDTGHPGNAFDEWVDVSPPSDDLQVQMTQHCPTPNPQGCRQPSLHAAIPLAQTSPGHWVAHLCYDGDAYVGPYTTTITVTRNGQELCHGDVNLNMFGPSAMWGCDYGCKSYGCNDYDPVAPDGPTIEPREPNTGP